MAKPYSQDLRDRVIRGGGEGKMEPPSGGSDREYADRLTGRARV